MDKQLIEIIGTAKKSFLMINGNNEQQWTKEANYAYQTLSASTYAANLAKAQPESVKAAMINLASAETTLNPSKALSYLIPRNKKIVFELSYKGKLDKADGIEWVAAYIVRQKDKFKLNDCDQKPTHEYNPFIDRGDVIGVYCVFKRHDGSFGWETMNVEEINNIMSRSQSASSGKLSPWKSDYEAMCKKSVINKASNLWKGSINSGYDALEIPISEETTEPEPETSTAAEAINNFSRPVVDEPVSDTPVEPEPEPEPEPQTPTENNLPPYPENNLPPYPENNLPPYPPEMFKASFPTWEKKLVTDNKKTGSEKAIDLIKNMQKKYTLTDAQIDTISSIVENDT